MTNEMSILQPNKNQDRSPSGDIGKAEMKEAFAKLTLGPDL